MNQTTNVVAVSIAVTTNTEEMFQARVAQPDYQVAKMVSTLNDVFNIALEQANYFAPESMFDLSNFANGTGYYDPLMTVGFEDEEGMPVPAFSSVAIHDPKTNRRLYLIVLSRGRNIIVHDRFTQKETGNTTTLVATGCGGTRLLGLDSSWSENIHDLVKASDVFGMEFDKRSNSVYIPKWRKENWFQANDSMLSF